MIVEKIRPKGRGLSPQRRKRLKGDRVWSREGESGNREGFWEERVRFLYSRGRIAGTRLPSLENDPSYSSFQTYEPPLFVTVLPYWKTPGCVTGPFVDACDFTATNQVNLPPIMLCGPLHHRAWEHWILVDEFERKWWQTEKSKLFCGE